ncbi:MAG TPA: hypothetical protein VFB21_01620 [Chthonomonadaceae bacterium]|nr:hypothetical protein [Chthonomonadaceae bacterium]
MDREFQYEFPPEIEPERAALRAVIEKALEENTLPAIQAAQKQLRAWLQKHPEDLVMWDAGEPLALTEDALRADESSPAFARSA